ncbi:MAG: BamA/TamA family outer membrane protein, partial [Myxococcales bacterium]|nr:BamA/TamA family outer membrane protein [Myxococcales bacterium]
MHRAWLQRRAGLGAAALALSTCACARLPQGQTAVDDVTVRGARALDSSEVEDRLATQPSPKFLGLFRGVVYDYALLNRATLQRDLARVERYYRERGYYSAHARAGRVIPTGRDHARVEIVVEEGPLTRNRNVLVEGIEGLDPALQASARAAAQVELAPDRAFQSERAERAEQAVRAALTDEGFAYATVKRDSFIDVVHHFADTTITVTPGELARFGPVRIEGLEPAGSGPRARDIPEAPVRRAIDIQEGATYSSRRLDAAMRALLELQVFSSVTVTPDLSHPETHVVPVAVKVEASNLRQIRVGGGAEFDALKTELHLVTGWEDENFLGGLRDFTVDFLPGVVLFPTTLDNPVKPTHLFFEERLRLQLIEPGFLEPATRGFVRPEFNVFPLILPEADRDPNDPVIGYLEFRGGLSLDRTFFKRLYVNLSYNAQVESPFTYFGDLDPALRTLVIAYPDLVTRLDLRDNPDQPHSGFYLGNDLQIAGGIFGGDVRDVRVQPEARAYVPLGRRLTLALRGSVGFLFDADYGHVVHSLEDNPPPVIPATTDAERAEQVRDIQKVLFRGLYSGGPTSNRGFPIRGVAPHAVIPFLNPTNVAAQAAAGCVPTQSTMPQQMPGSMPGSQSSPPMRPDPCSVPIGGFTLWEFSTEVRLDLRGPLSTAAFCDFGDVSAKTFEFRPGWLHTSCGLGIRYQTPVGPIRADIGYRIPFLQLLGQPNELAAWRVSPSNGVAPNLFGDARTGSG